MVGCRGQPQLPAVLPVLGDARPSRGRQAKVSVCVLTASVHPGPVGEGGRTRLDKAHLVRR